MPFWWRRRRKFWTRNRFTRRRRYNNRKGRRRFTRKQYRRPYTRRRRRRRRRKVRRKKRKLTVQQWQPDSIVKCKIKGNGCMIVGAEGRQMRCYTDVKDDWVPPKTPSGGGFAYDLYTLNYLYSEYKFHANYWTKSNLYKDLCRYLGVKIIFYRHQKLDFIVSYDRDPPYNITKASYMGCHPQQMLLHRRHKLILSKQTKPNGKIRTKIFIKPTRLMINKWFFTDSFYKYPLCCIKATVADMNNSYQQCCNENQQLGMYVLNTLFYQDGNWGNSASAYKPLKTYTQPKTYYVKFIDDTKKTVTVTFDNYNNSISYEKGWFQTNLLRAWTFWDAEYKTKIQDARPVNTCLYNPNLDSGVDTAVWVSSILNESYNPPATDTDLIITGAPLWLCLWGFFDYINKVKHDVKDFLKTSIVVLKSPAIFYFSETGQSYKRVIPLDEEFIKGKSFFNTTPDYHSQKSWYPTYLNQQKILNMIAESGPFVPKLSGIKESVWELKYHYCFYFKWGGPQTTDPEVVNPKDQGHPDIPNLNPQTVQIIHPGKQSSKSLIHSWDYRRGFIKEKAIQRMLTNLPTESSIHSATEEESKTPKRKKPQIQTQEYKKRKVLKTLHSLCEESTFQETPQTTLHDLIKQQQQQQQQLKRDIIHLLLEMKNKQQMLQLQTGLLD
nr:MAG: ORF1 [Torque teno midi virus]